MSEVGRDSPKGPDSTRLGLAFRRQQKGISLEQIAEATKIGVRSLRAIETEEFKKLPGGIYSTSYIRQYARAIDVDELQILGLYYSVMRLSPPESSQVNPSGSEGRFVRRLWRRHTSAVLGSST